MSFPRRRSFFLSFFFPSHLLSATLFTSSRRGSANIWIPVSLHNYSAAHVLLLSVWISSADKLMGINVMDAAAHVSATAWGPSERASLVQDLTIGPSPKMPRTPFSELPRRMPSDRPVRLREPNWRCSEFLSARSQDISC